MPPKVKWTAKAESEKSIAPGLRAGRQSARCWLMKNVQVIDGADNCAYDIFSISDEQFLILFPEKGQNIEFVEDVIERLGDEVATATLRGLWERPCPKSTVQGIHGTLFFQLAGKRQYYPSKQEADLNLGGRGWAYPEE